LATLTIRNLEDDVRDKLRIRAAHGGRSMEDEVRSILRAAVAGAKPSDVWLRSRELFGDGNGVELNLPSRSVDRATPDFK
jgi:antitoxin FitA